MKYLLVTAVVVMMSVAHAMPSGHKLKVNGDDNFTCAGDCARDKSFNTNSFNTTNHHHRNVDRSINNSSKSRSKSSSQSNNSVNIEGDSIRGSAIAPSVVAMAGYSCTGASASASAGWLGGSLGLGGTKEDKECTKRETVKSLQAAILSGLYTPEQIKQLRDSSFKILMNMREVAQPTENATRQQPSGYHNR